MKVETAVTRTCNHCPILEEELRNLGLPYSLRYIEDDPAAIVRCDERPEHHFRAVSGCVFRLAFQPGTGYANWSVKPHA